jgi:hypothetical protein
MKTSKINLNAVRFELKNLKGTPCAIVKSIYAAIEGETESAKYLKAVLPAKRQEAIDAIDAIKNAYNVGQVVTNKAGKSRTIRFSADMVLRYFTKANNGKVEAFEKAQRTAKRTEEKAAREAKKAAEKAAKDEARKAREAARAEKQQKAVEKALKASTIAPEKPQTKPAAKGTKGTKAGKKAA